MKCWAKKEQKVSENKTEMNKSKHKLRQVKTGK